MTPRVGLVGTVGAAILLVIAALLLIAAAPAQAQEPRLARLPEAARTQIDALVTAAAANGLPIEPLIDRALEGLAKGAPPLRIVTAVTRLRDELVLVRGALGERSSPAELTAGASALRAGATTDALATLRRLRGQRSLTVPASVLADLVAGGVPADTAVGSVLALATNAGDADYIAFRRNVQRDIALGASPAAALGVRLLGPHGLSEATALDPTPGGRGKQKP